MLQFDETNSNSLCGPDESVDLQTFYSISRETFVIDLFKDGRYWRESEIPAMESTYKLD